MPVIASMVISAAYLASDDGAYWAGFVVVAVPIACLLAAAAWRAGAPRAHLLVLAVGLVGFMVRNIGARLGGETVAGPLNLFMGVGYLLVCGALIALAFRRRADGTRAPLNRDAALDGLLIISGATAIILTQYTLPALELEGVSPLYLAQITLFPVVDVLVILAIVYLSFVSRPGLPARRLLLGTVILLFVFDMGRAHQVNAGIADPARWTNVPLALAYGLLGAFALHPSLPEIGRGRAREVQSWNRVRVAILAAGLLAPSVLVVATPAHSPTYHWVIATAAATASMLVLIRSVRAVRAYSEVHTELRVQAERDPLTGLANRTAFMTRLAAAMDEAQADTEAGRTVSVLFIDLGGFKAINDTRGHATGDALLVAVARRLRAALRSDDFAARLGGDEFALVAIDDAAGSVGERLATRVHGLFDSPFAVGSLNMPVRAAVGLANTGQACDGPRLARELVSAADAAMYQAKRAGSATWVRAAYPAPQSGGTATSGDSTGPGPLVSSPSEPPLPQRATGND